MSSKSKKKEFSIYRSYNMVFDVFPTFFISIPSGRVGPVCPW